MQTAKSPRPERDRRKDNRFNEQQIRERVSQTTPPVSAVLLETDSERRGEAEHFIRTIFDQRYGARVSVFAPCLLMLEQAGHQTRIHNPASLAEVLAEPDAILLVITSTHGAGDVPDNLQPFAKDLADQHPDLNALKYGVIGLGDRSYDTFCQGGKTLDRLLAECGASRIGDRLEIDVTQHEIPEDAAEAWIHDWMQMIA